MEEKVYDIISEHFHVEKDSFSDATNLVVDLHADSLDLVELIMTFEDTFSVSIPDEVALEVKTVGDIIEYLKKA